MPTSLRAARTAARVVLCAVLSFCAGGSCTRRGATPPLTTRLVDLYQPETVEGRAAGPVATSPRTEWRFDGPPPAVPSPKFAATRGWEPGPGVSGLEVRGGRLVGRTTTETPILHLERTVGAGARDLLHAVEVRMRASEGANVAVAFRRAEKLDLAEVVAQSVFPWAIASPIVAGEEERTYTLKGPFPVTVADTGHVLIRPTDAKGARFEIESVRLVFRKEHLAGVASGVGWHGLSEVYRESLVSRSPERMRFDVSLPARPWLDLAVGTIEDGPVTFRVGARERGGRSGEAAEKVLLERTVTTPHRWEAAAVDLSGLAGRDVTLSLSVAAERPGSLGFWGAPAVRSKGATAAPATDRGGGDPPHGVILIWADTLRRDHLDLHGYERETAPVVRRLAAEGTLFRDCVVQGTWTKVSTPSLLTSLYPTSHGVKDFTDRIPGSADTLAEVYRSAGYATLSMSSVLFVGRFTNLHQGFEEVHEDGSLPDQESSKTAREYVDRLLPWLEAHREVPFFVLLHVTDPHDPYKPYAPYDTLWADPSWKEEHERQTKEVRKFVTDPLLQRFGMPTRDELVKAGFDPATYVGRDRDWYDGSIRAMDAEVGRLLERLRALGLHDRTLIVFTGDHGEEFHEHGRMFHGQTAYGELANVPLILRGPGVPKGAVVDATVQTIDIMPTLLEMSGLPAPKAVQGRSLLPLLSSSAPPAERPAIIEKAATEHVGAPPPRDTESVAIVSGGFKLIHNTKRPPRRPEFELYDHGRDPLDQSDVAARHPDVVQRLARDLGAWRSKAAAARLPSDAASSQQISKEELERLRALGYIQ